MIPEAVELVAGYRSKALSPVEVTRAALDAIDTYDARDWSAMPTPSTSFLHGLDDGVAGLRIGYSPDLGF
ncbi:MAG TPA: hypothetical protein VE666_11485, partial [Mycobacterium sp.]|nr:hypothetical protein [Mycobacterium sp.]